jgi:hypothetical protein
MGFKVGNLNFTKIDGGVVISRDEVCSEISDNDWISVITEMSHKPENADQLKKAEEFHLEK